MIDLYMMCIDLKNPQSSIRQKSNNIIQEIYGILNNPTEKTVKIIEGWKEDFKYIYGNVDANLSSNSKLNTTEILNRYGISEIPDEAAEKTQLLFYSIQTYFSILIKCMMREILDEGERTEISPEGLVLGDFAKKHGIINYCNPDWYSWPIFEMENGFNRIIIDIEKSVNNYQRVITLSDFAKYNNYDYIKQMYEAIIPKELRHALGEYYTPDWLAEETLLQAVDFNGTIEDSRFVDPTCGSGTFLFKTIIEKRKHGCTLDNIITNVSGVDINPLAVLTAKTNYLLAIIDLLKGDNEIEIPIFNADILRFDENDLYDEVVNFLSSDNPTKAIHYNAAIERRKTASMEKADVIVGNPPWVNWEYMPEQYRRGSQHLWVDYQLFSAKGRDLSFSKEDISVLITYVVIDKLLKDTGILAFVIRQGVFKSAQNGVGFRRFRVKEEYGVKVLKVEDLSKIKAFDNATNSTALLYLKKGENTEYPLSYVLWEKRKDLKKISFNAYSELREVKSQIATRNQKAMPAVEEDESSIWITADEDELFGMKKILGKNQYRARTGVFTGGANAVYWLDITGASTQTVDITNLIERAKRKSKKVKMTIEKDYVYPMLKGCNVKKWKTEYDTYLLCVHTVETKMWPIAQEELKVSSPKTFAYLEMFKEDLDGRKGFAGWEKEIQKKEFHAILRIGEYTFSQYKVIWKYIASEFICAVISSVNDKYLGNKMLVPNEKIMYISTEDEMEAYYICGILSSTLVANCVKSYMNPTSISAHVLNKLNIPEFDSTNEKHVCIANECKCGHQSMDITPFIRRIDIIVEELYGIS